MHSNLQIFWCVNNNLSSLDIRNGNNTAILNIDIQANGSLLCVSVDDADYSNTNWTNKDVQTSYAITCSPAVGYTFVPDNNFEQALINLGYDNFLDDYVYTDSINSVTHLDVSSSSISD